MRYKKTKTKREKKKEKKEKKKEKRLEGGWLWKQKTVKRDGAL